MTRRPGESQYHYELRLMGRDAFHLPAGRGPAPYHPDETYNNYFDRNRGRQRLDPEEWVRERRQYEYNHTDLGHSYHRPEAAPYHPDETYNNYFDRNRGRQRMTRDEWAQAHNVHEEPQMRMPRAYAEVPPWGAYFNSRRRPETVIDPRPGATNFLRPNVDTETRPSPDFVEALRRIDEITGRNPILNFDYVEAAEQIYGRSGLSAASASRHIPITDTNGETMEVQEVEKQQVVAPPETIDPSNDQRTIAQLRKYGYSSLSSEMIKDVLYLEQLGATTNTEVSEWSAIHLIKDVERGDKKALNKLFFEESEKKKEILGEVTAETFSRIQKVVFDQAMKTKETSLQNERAQFESYLRDLRSHERRCEDLRLAAHQAFDRARLIEGITPDTTMDEFKKTLNSPFFAFHNFALGKAHYRTRTDVVIHYVNKAQKVDIQVNFGKLTLTLEISNGALRILPLENNLFSSSGCYHPFVSREGNVCFGTAQDAANRHRVEGKWGTLFEILASVLSTYDGGSNPYCSLPIFHNEALTGQATRRTGSRCSHCDETSCQCPSCSYCGGRRHAKAECPQMKIDYPDRTPQDDDDDSEVETCENCENEMDDCTCDGERSDF